LDSLAFFAAGIDTVQRSEVLCLRVAVDFDPLAPPVWLGDGIDHPPELCTGPFSGGAVGVAGALGGAGAGVEVVVAGVLVGAGVGVEVVVAGGVAAVVGVVEVGGVVGVVGVVVVGVVVVGVVESGAVVAPVGPESGVIGGVDDVVVVVVVVVVVLVSVVAGGAVSAAAAPTGTPATATPAASAATRRRALAAPRRSTGAVNPAIAGGGWGRGRATAAPSLERKMNCDSGCSIISSGTEKRARQSKYPPRTSGTAPGTGRLPSARRRSVQLRKAGCAVSSSPMRTQRTGAAGGGRPGSRGASSHTAAHISFASS
jgi:hypothetical protein